MSGDFWWINLFYIYSPYHFSRDTLCGKTSIVKQGLSRISSLIPYDVMTFEVSRIRDVTIFVTVICITSTYFLWISDLGLYNPLLVGIYSHRGQTRWLSWTRNPAQVSLHKVLCMNAWRLTSLLFFSLGKCSMPLLARFLSFQPRYTILQASVLEMQPLRFRTKCCLGLRWENTRT